MKRISAAGLGLKCPAQQQLAAALPGIAFVLLLVYAAVATAAAPQPTRTFAFTEDGVRFDASFTGARLNAVERTGAGGYTATIRPELPGTNNSPWYAFRVSAAQPRTVKLRLEYAGGRHRYPPKISTDGRHWRRLAERAYRVDGTSAVLQLRVGPRPLWVAAQELIGDAQIHEWMTRLGQRPFVDLSVAGKSAQGRPMRMLTLGNRHAAQGVALIARQHPPEVTGALALMSFVDTIASEEPLARRFRQSFQVLVLPLANPDGVAAGNWRRNARRGELNRDWAKFRQPETRVLRDALLAFHRRRGGRVAMFIDFHSTSRDVFYVKVDDPDGWLFGFAQDWLETLDQRLPGYPVRQALLDDDVPTSITWASRTLKSPAVIYEVGDNTDRALLRRVARTAARVMMKLLLEETSSTTGE